MGQRLKDSDSSHPFHMSSIALHLNGNVCFPSAALGGSGQAFAVPTACCLSPGVFCSCALPALLLADSHRVSRAFSSHGGVRPSPEVSSPARHVL